MEKPGRQAVCLLCPAWLGYALKAGGELLLHGNLLDAAQVPASLELGSEEGFHDVGSRGGINEPPGHYEYVGIVVLAGQPGNFGNPAKGGPYPGMVVECHVDAVSTATDGDSRVAFPAFYGVGKGVGVVRIVATLCGASAEVLVCPSFSFEPLPDKLFQLVSGVIGGYAYSLVFHSLLYFQAMDGFPSMACGCFVEGCKCSWL